MRIVLASDTHGKHHEFTLPDGDLLIHAGDFTKRGELPEVTAFMQWLGSQPHPHKVLIAGNHDFLAERDPALFASLIPDGVHYLNDSGVELLGMKIWGSPVQPWFYDWAFNRSRGADIQRHWDLIPAGTDILVTHGPPYGILDRTKLGQLVGCEDLTRTLERMHPKPRLHVFGHIHEAHGLLERDGTTYVNASVLNLEYKKTWEATVLDW